VLRRDRAVDQDSLLQGEQSVRRCSAAVRHLNPLYKGYQSIIAYANVKKKIVADEVFTLEFLPKIHQVSVA
jgi:hypothetical protein